MAQSPQTVLTTLHKLQKSHELSIIKLSEPVSAPLKSGDRTSNGSAADPLENPSPASLEADLEHYKVKFIFPSSFLPTPLFLRPLNHTPKCDPRTNTPSPGTLLQTPLLLPRTSNQRKVHPCHCRGPPPRRRTSRKHRFGSHITQL